MSIGAKLKTRASNPSPRHEFRVWGEDLTEILARLKDTATETGSETRRERYVVFRQATGYIVKIRDNMLDVKTLEATESHLERWRPIFKLPFPLSRDRIQRDVAPILSVQPESLRWPRYDAESFINHAVKPFPHLADVGLQKKRSRFTLLDCMVEFTIVMIDAASFNSVATESEDAALTRRVVGELGLCGAENVNYQEFLRRYLAMM